MDTEQLLIKASLVNKNAKELLNKLRLIEHLKKKAFSCFWISLITFKLSKAFHHYKEYKDLLCYYKSEIAEIDSAMYEVYKIQKELKVAIKENERRTAALKRYKND